MELVKSQVYYIVGDVHGQYQRLSRRLKSAGLTSKNGKLTFNSGKILFLGDLLDRGPDSRKVIELVKQLHEAGIAEVILGNHEFNFLGYLNKLDKRSFLRRHTLKNLRQHRDTLKSYKGHKNDLETHLTWLKSLPLFFENKHFRAVHACWDPQWIKWLNTKYPEGLKNEGFFQNSYKIYKKSFFCIERLLKGPELILPETFTSIDSDGNIQSGIRYKWWQKNKGKSLKEVITKWNEKWQNTSFNSSFENRSLSYSKKEKPLFIGHYNFNNHPEFHNNNFLCLDCSDKEGNRVLIYRHEIGKPISLNNLIF